jgi:hypothetical protein
LAVWRHGDHVLHLEMVEQQAVDRPRAPAGEAVLDPVAVEPHHARLADVLAAEEHHHAVLGEQVRDLLGQVEVDVVAVGPVQAADRVHVLELADAVLERGQPLVHITHHRLSRFCLYS